MTARARRRSFNPPDSHLADDEEDDGHGGAEQRDQHEELEPKNQTLNHKNSQELLNIQIDSDKNLESLKTTS